MTVPRVWRLVRAGSIEHNPTTLAQRAGTFAASAPDGTVLLTRRDGDGLSHFMIASNEVGVDQATLHLAHTVAARVDEVDVPGRLMTSHHLAVARFSPGSSLGRDTQAGAELAEIAGRLASALRSGEWVATVLRQPTHTETKRYQRWIGHHLGGARPTHHSMQQTAVVMSLWAGAESKKVARALLTQVAAAMPGFDVQIDTMPVSPLRNGLITILAGAAATAAAASAHLVGLTAADPWLETGAGLLVGAGPVAVVGGILYLAGRIPSWAEKVRRLIRYNLLPEPGARLLPPAAPRRESFDREGKKTEASDGAYPLHARAFLAGPQLLAGVVAPHAGAASGSASTQTRTAPSTMRDRIGPLLGDNDGAPVYLSAADAYAGVVAFGQAGSGKSRLIQSMFGWAALDRREPAGLPGFPGSQHTLIAFESKGDGAEAYEEWAKVAGDPVLRVDFAGSGRIRLDILNVPGNAERKARAAVNAMKYAFSDGSIMEASFAALTQVMTGGFVAAAEPEVAAEAELPVGASPFFYASVLLGNRGDEAGVALAGAIKSVTARRRLDETTDLGMATVALSALYEGKTPAQRAALTQAPRTKVGALLAAESYWSRPAAVTWDQALLNHGSVVINTGIAADGDLVDDVLAEQMQAMFMFTLYEAIKRNCSGWYESGRAVSIFADELKLLAGSSSQVITWFRDQGRSYGVRAVFATQYPEQLAPDVRNAVMGFGTLLAFSQNSPDVIRSLIADLNVSGDEWTSADVANLPAYEVVTRATVGRARQTPFTARIPDFWGRRAEFKTMQGYDAPADTPEWMR